MREFMLIIHFIGVSMGVGIGITHMTIGIKSKSLSLEERDNVLRTLYSLHLIGKISLVLIVFSGVVLIVPFFDSIKNNGLLILKLFLVLILIACVLLISKLAKKDHRTKLPKNKQKIEGLGKVALITSLLTIIVAVSLFR